MKTKKHLVMKNTSHFIQNFFNVNSKGTGKEPTGNSQMNN